MINFLLLAAIAILALYLFKNKRKKLQEEIHNRPYLYRLIEDSKQSGILHGEMTPVQAFKALAGTYDLPYDGSIPIKEYLDKLEAILKQRDKTT